MESIDLTAERNTRRTTLRSIATGWLSGVLLSLGTLLPLVAPAQPATATAAIQRPNIVWIVGDDLGTQIASYGARNAITPTLDRLASSGMRFENAYAVSPICAPSRSALITGRYPTTIGTHHMRSRLAVPPPTLLDLLDNAGYHIAWPQQPDTAKTDFNFDSPKHTQSASDWLQEAPPEPFFAYVNDMVVHEGKLFISEAEHLKLTAALSPSERQDTDRVEVPPYYPDVPTVRRTLARYAEMVTAFDRNVQKVLDLLRDRGVLDRTIVVVLGDNGPGFPRGKRLLYDEGTRIPLIIAGPGIEPGVVRRDLVSLLDLAPTTLAIAGIQPPTQMAGRTIVGPRVAPSPPYLVSTRDRADEVADRIRSVRDGRYLYISNLMPQVGHSSIPEYARRNPIMGAMVEGRERGMLNDAQLIFFNQRKPDEELYDTVSDPHQIRNLASAPELRSVLERMRTQLGDWTRRYGDLGAEPESELMRRGLLIAPSRSTVIPVSSR